MPSDEKHNDVALPIENEAPRIASSNSLSNGNEAPRVASSKENLQYVHNPDSESLHAIHGLETGAGQIECVEGALILRNSKTTTQWRFDRNSFDMERIKRPDDGSNQDVQIASANGSELFEKLSSGMERSSASNYLVDGQGTPHVHRTFSNRSDGQQASDMNPPTQTARHVNGNTFLLALGALGVVFGDIGTSPLYTVQTIFLSIPATPENVIGAISSIFWLLNLAVTLKYVTVIMRADNRGEGGIMALTALASQSSHGLTRPWWKTMTMMIGERFPYFSRKMTLLRTCEPSFLILKLQF